MSPNLTPRYLGMECARQMVNILRPERLGQPRIEDTVDAMTMHHVVRVSVSDRVVTFDVTPDWETMDCDAARSRLLNDIVLPQLLPNGY